MLKIGAADERSGKALRGWQTMPVDSDGANWNHRVDDDHWEQPGNLFRAMNADQRQTCSTTRHAR